jgi:hypothetical protein
VSGFLDALERQLSDAVEQHARRRSRAPRRRWIAAAALVTALVAILALIAGGVFGARGATHSASQTARRAVSRSTGRLAAAAASGVPARGHSRLTALRVPDPAGGAPWGLRIVHTATNLVCLQVGRLEHGRLQALPESDGFVRQSVSPTLRLLPPPAVPPGAINNGVVESQVVPASPRGAHPASRDDCRVPGVSLSNYTAEVARRAAVSQAPGGAVPRRAVAFGLLGPDALSVRYRLRGRTRTQPVEARSGAYLIVAPAPAPAVVTGVAYRRDGRVCWAALGVKSADACRPR